MKGISKLGVFATMLALVAVCAFTDADLAAGAGTAVAEEADGANTAQETGHEGVQTAEEASEASDGDSESLQDDSGESRPADGDEG